VAGQAAGWGFQFQSPVFVVLMAWLLFGIGLNLSGVFGIDGGVAGAGQSLAARGGHAGSFFTGLLAVLVATPCTAPFMGAAIAGALVAPPVVTLLVFATMGIGLALPYALLAVAPGLARALPRPGAWMDLLKELLAFPMYAAVVWLVWVVSQEAGPDGVLAVIGGLGLLGFAGWALGRAQRGAGFGRRLGQAAAVAGLAAAASLLPGIAPVQAVAQGTGEASEPYTAARLAELRAQNRPVFVNMTAAWCVSCLVNERVALGTQAVRDAFAARDVAYLKGDWTQQDPAISTFLHEHGRDGVPLYILYTPGQEPKVLPQILTPGIVLASLGEAKT
jgi:thiol:disulfide interchange protein DsbD